VDREAGEADDERLLKLRLQLGKGRNADWALAAETVKKADQAGHAALVHAQMKVDAFMYRLDHGRAPQVDPIQHPLDAVVAHAAGKRRDWARDQPALVAARDGGKEPGEYLSVVLQHQDAANELVQPAGGQEPEESADLVDAEGADRNEHVAAHQSLPDRTNICRGRQVESALGQIALLWSGCYCGCRLLLALVATPGTVSEHTGGGQDGGKDEGG